MTYKNNTFFWNKIKSSAYKNECNLYFSDFKMVILYHLAFLDQSPKYTENYNILKKITNNLKNRNLYDFQGIYQQKIQYLLGTKNKRAIFVDQEDKTLFNLHSDVFDFILSDYFDLIHLNNLTLSNSGLKKLKKNYGNINIIPFFNKVYIQKSLNSPTNSIKYLDRVFKIQKIKSDDEILNKIDLILKPLHKEQIYNNVEISDLFVNFYMKELIIFNLSSIDDFDERIDAFVFVLTKFIKVYIKKLKS